MRLTEPKSTCCFFVSIKGPFLLPPPSFFYHNINLYVGNCSLPLTEHCHFGASFISRAALLKEALRSMCRLLDLTGLECGTSCLLTCTQPKSHLTLDLSSNTKPQTESVKPSRLRARQAADCSGGLFPPFLLRRRDSSSLSLQHNKTQTPAPLPPPHPQPDHCGAG